jgi:hypothetical protein
MTLRHDRLAIALGLSLTWMSGAWSQDAMPDLPLPPPPNPQSSTQQPPSQQIPTGDDDLAFDWVILGGLDKLTARVVTIETEVGRSTRFGQLEIIARSCRQRRPEAGSPESAAFLDIWDNKPGLPAASVFRGWMFASSPALSAMEHPIYDVWVLSCKGAGR